jgi:hypothetical protein
LGEDRESDPSLPQDIKWKGTVLGKKKSFILLHPKYTEVKKWGEWNSMPISLELGRQKQEYF